MTSSRPWRSGKDQRDQRNEETNRPSDRRDGATPAAAVIRFVTSPSARPARRFVELTLPAVAWLRRRLEEHPPMPLGIRCVVEPTVRLVPELAKDLRAGRSRALEMRVDALDLHERTVDHEGNIEPCLRAVTGLRVVLWRPVLGPGPAEHHD